MKYLIIALFAFMACLCANAASNITQVLADLPDGGYIMDMGVGRSGLFDITDLDGKPVPGSPFTIDSSSVPPTGPATRNATSIKTKDQWGVSTLSHFAHLSDSPSLPRCPPLKPDSRVFFP